jgi:hypothetical protein
MPTALRYLQIQSPFFNFLFFFRVFRGLFLFQWEHNPRLQFLDRRGRRIVQIELVRYTGRLVAVQRHPLPKFRELLTMGE